MVTIILVIYKSDKQKLSKILKKIGNKFNIIIIDNSYNYDFSDIKISNKVKIIRSKNIGNGAGINLGLSKCNTKFAIYSDIDVEFKKDVINNLIKSAKKIKNFSVLIPNHGNIKSKKSSIKKFTGEASMMLLNKQMIKKIGLFDEKFFLYFEELDLFYRSKKHNLDVYFLTKIKIKHNRASSIKSIDTENLRQWHYMWSMFYFYKKNYSYLYGLKKIFLYLLKDILNLLISFLLFNIKDFKKRFYRIFGTICSLLGMGSFLRP